jgi:Family of unknown function (DUF6886)
MPLYHFSEEPNLRVFEPRPSPLAGEALVWAIDEWHAPMYYFPRDCPRACFWPGPQTTAEDRERWFGGIGAKMVIAVESAWLDRIRSTKLYRYVLPEQGFEQHDATAGHWVSRAAVTPIECEPVGDLLAALASAEVELRITPSLADLWSRVIASTLEFSGTRLRNAQGWPANV